MLSTCDFSNRHLQVTVDSGETMAARQHRSLRPFKSQTGFLL
jgi:hypothetical protein